MKETEPKDATPEQLIQMLDAEMAAHRSQRQKVGRNRATVLVAGVLFIVCAAGAALLVLEQMLTDMRPNGRMPASGMTPAAGK
ncbi:hypothetical protein CfE428DRAFT_2724 [Chthoniobacter flavus Ellin428]|uniref:Uncharacterized protein n=1 Tax=Chthoniobacter flavus Ellin428 TaxID=497964 RepID=B4D1D6_9BACT|nr:hypothetical protein [Chthoniobacter flavus]EDY19548.1 hypothetical protein CfE428DRAFT_2724 [Chthoniobacter flavus Ellin428]TCO92792.1 hypothetical protein EV701_10569 [Chthoniobacter flavus]